MQACACACIGEPRSEPGPGLPFCSSTQHLSALSLWNVFFVFFFFPFSVHFHLSPDEHFPQFKQCLLCCGRRRGGVRFISVSSPRELCPSRPPCFILLPTELIKINMVLFAYIRLACNLADGGAPRGTAAACIWICFRKMPGKKPQAQRAHTHVGAQGHGSVFSREAKKKEKKKPSPLQR